jgi:hypothetical protein
VLQALEDRRHDRTNRAFLVSETLKNRAIQSFLDFYREDLEAEVLDDRNVILSFPVHFSGFHRVEVTVTSLEGDRYILSDGAKTLEELKSAGYELTSKLKKRVELISRAASLRVVNGYLVAESEGHSLGSSIQSFVEAAKTIGDAYLVQRAAAPKETHLYDLVSDLLNEQRVPYQLKHPLRGKVENHTIDFYFPPNGVPGLALTVMGNPSRMAAEAWAFKSWDIKQENERTKVGIVFDSEAGESSRTVLRASADLSVPSDEIQGLKGELRSIGILKHA